ncbi:MFS transporter [Paenibacillus sp. P26]|nr:MFS transporter [Paenibacillus sp. P26]
MLELRVFGSPDFTKGVVLAWIAQIAMFGTLLLIPLFLQQVKGYGSLMTGLLMLPHAIASGILTLLAGRLFDKTGARPLVITGLGLITAGLLVLSHMTAGDGPAMIVIPLLLLGTGMGLATMTLNTHVLQTVPGPLVGRVVPMTMAVQQVMLSVAVAGLSGYVTMRTRHDLPSAQHGTDASMSAFGDTFLLCACIAAIGVLAGFLLRRAGGTFREDKNAARPGQ